VYLHCAEFVQLNSIRVCFSYLLVQLISLHSSSTSQFYVPLNYSITLDHLNVFSQLLSPFTHIYFVGDDPNPQYVFLAWENNHTRSLFFLVVTLFNVTKNKISSTKHHLGVGIGQTARQRPIARPTKSSVRPNSFNKWVKLELFKKPINLIRPDLGL